MEIELLVKEHQWEGLPRYRRDPDFYGATTTTVADIVKQLPTKELVVEAVHAALDLVYDEWWDLKRLPPGSTRAKIIHQRMDKAISTHWKKYPRDKAMVSCFKKSRCSGCCHTNVDITTDEIDLLADIVEAGHPIDRELLELQAAVPDHFESDDTPQKQWGKLTFAERKCIFLSTEGCTIYDNRPANCRKWFVSDPRAPEVCADYDHEGPVLSINKAEYIASAAINLDINRTGRLSNQLLKELRRRDVRRGQVS